MTENLIKNSSNIKITMPEEFSKGKTTNVIKFLDQINNLS